MAADCEIDQHVARRCRSIVQTVNKLCSSTGETAVGVAGVGGREPVPPMGRQYAAGTSSAVVRCGPHGGAVGIGGRADAGERPPAGRTAAGMDGRPGGGVLQRGQPAVVNCSSSRPDRGHGKPSGLGRQPVVSRTMPAACTSRGQVYCTAFRVVAVVNRRGVDNSNTAILPSVGPEKLKTAAKADSTVFRDNSKVLESRGLPAEQSRQKPAVQNYNRYRTHAATLPAAYGKFIGK